MHATVPMSEPVPTIREDTVTTPSTGPILLCYDRSVGSVRAIETAGALFPGRAAIVLHVWSPMAALGAVYGALVPSAAFDEREITQAAMLLAEEGVRMADGAGLEATPAIASARFDGTANTILAVAEQHQAGVIVVGARGLSAMRAIVLGSVSHGVVQHAHCPVLVIPPVQHAEPLAAMVEPVLARTFVPAGIPAVATP
jgi:nucleotide-binding universal stress UspA family protein